jgi:antitoxin ParD1/3/4
MGTTHKTITVTDQQDNWIEAQISAGEFTNDSEYIRDPARRDRAGKADIEEIRAALIEAEKSGEPRPFDGDLFKQEMIAKHGKRKG